VAVFGLGVLVAALAASADPYRQTRQFHQVVTCERSAGDCFGSEQGFITGRRYTTSTDSDGNPSTTYEVTWQRADGSRQTRDVSRSLYRKAEQGQPVTLRLWQEEVVGLEVADKEQWFLPKPGKILGYWLFLASSGLWALLWGLLSGRWQKGFVWKWLGRKRLGPKGLGRDRLWRDEFGRNGFRKLASSVFSWICMSYALIYVTTDALAYGLDKVVLFGGILVCVCALGVLGWILLYWRKRW